MQGLLLLPPLLLGGLLFWGGNLKYDRAPSARENTASSAFRFSLAQGHEAPNGRPEPRTAGLPPPAEGPAPGPLRPFPRPVGEPRGTVPGRGQVSPPSPRGGRPGPARRGAAAAAGRRQVVAAAAPGIRAGGGGSPAAPPGRAPSAGGSPRPGGFCP